jgi:hypothetical protein
MCECETMDIGSQLHGALVARLLYLLVIASSVRATSIPSLNMQRATCSSA